MRRYGLRATALSLCWVFAALAALAAPGDPERSTIEDRNDVPGRMDLEEARYVHDLGEAPTWHLTTHGTWRPIDIWDSGFVWIELDTRYGEDADFTALVRADRSRLVGVLFRITPDPRAADGRIADIDVWRRSAKGVSLAVPFKHLVFGEARTTFRWWVISSFVGDVCPATCFDLAPDDPVLATSEDIPGGPPPARG